MCVIYDYVNVWPGTDVAQVSDMRYCRQSCAYIFVPTVWAESPLLIKLDNALMHNVRFS